MRGVIQGRWRHEARIRGFTLIEIMIVVAVIGILAAIALPSYQDYTVRSKASEGLGFASAAKVAVVSAYSSGGLPANNAAAGLSEAGDVQSQYVDSIQIEGGNIRVTFNDTIPQLYGRSVMLAAKDRGGAIDWCCYSPDIEGRYMPATCRDDARCAETRPAICTGMRCRCTDGWILDGKNCKKP
ncbi:pilin [Thiocapsa roseopersicina]|uniref:Type IV pilus assembly protein PilE n=1 Tax=Thiocapsa roseopersicina TaxID=1058 RepID=A0A1H3D120_THIRO|nr:pilin [Thiocapsa roseopersicina]SDX60172.1 type IV pilus assembly protein PilE [Thiocapsa roseopersicina]